MYEEEENRWRCSFRSDGKWINVNELLQTFGGVEMLQQLVCANGRMMLKNSGRKSLSGLL